MNQQAKRVIPIRQERPLDLSPEQRSAIEDACERLKSQAGALMSILHAIQAALGFVPKDAVPLIADRLNLSRAEIHGVLSFYHWFRKEKPGRHVVHLCRAEACQAVGAAALEAHAKRCLGIDYHETTADGAVTLEPAYCLGNCALGPSMLLDEQQLVGRVTPARFEALMAEKRTTA